MTYWQGLLVEIIPGVPADTRTSWQVSGSRCPISLVDGAHSRDVATGDTRISCFVSRWFCLLFCTIVLSTTKVRPPPHRRQRLSCSASTCDRLCPEFSLDEGVIHTSVMQNVKHVISQKDVVQDAYHNFMPSYTVRPPAQCVHATLRGSSLVCKLCRTMCCTDLTQMPLPASTAQRRSYLGTLGGPP